MARLVQKKKCPRQCHAVFPVDGKVCPMKKFGAASISLSFGLGLTVATANAQQAPVNLGSNSTFAILAGTTVTVTGGGTIGGNVGIFPGTAYVAGTPPVTVKGTIYAGRRATGPNGFDHRV
jgi:hypothetical protein